jgi:hypothetical protein
MLYVWRVIRYQLKNHIEIIRHEYMPKMSLTVYLCFVLIYSDVRTKLESSWLRNRNRVTSVRDGNVHIRQPTGYTRGRHTLKRLSNWIQIVDIKDSWKHHSFTWFGCKKIVYCYYYYYYYYYYYHHHHHHHHYHNLLILPNTVRSESRCALIKMLDLFFIKNV